MPIKRLKELSLYLTKNNMTLSQAHELEDKHRQCRKKLVKDIMRQNPDLAAYASGDITEYGTNIISHGERLRLAYTGDDCDPCDYLDQQSEFFNNH